MVLIRGQAGDVRTARVGGGALPGSRYSGTGPAVKGAPRASPIGGPVGRGRIRPSSISDFSTRRPVRRCRLKAPRRVPSGCSLIGVDRILAVETVDASVVGDAGTPFLQAPVRSRSRGHVTTKPGRNTVPTHCAGRPPRAGGGNCPQGPYSTATRTAPGRPLPAAESPGTGSLMPALKYVPARVDDPVVEHDFGGIAILPRGATP